MARALQIATLLIAWAVWSAPAAAQCINTMKPSCGVYQTCFAQACNCSTSPDEYFVAFGASYCKAFLEQSEFSENGVKWRDSTLRCLQEAIVPALPSVVGGACNCNAAKQYALSTHVACYTQPSASVCDLPIADISKVAATILADGPFKQLLKDKQGALAQALATVEVCVSTAKDPASRTSWQALRLALATLSAAASNESHIKATFSTYHEASQRTAGEIDSRLSSSGFAGTTTNTSRSLYMDLLRAFGMAQIKFGHSCFDLGCGVLVKATVGKRKPGAKDSVLDVGVLAIGKDPSDAFARSVTSSGLEAPLVASQSAHQVEKGKSYYFWTTKGGITIYPY